MKWTRKEPRAEATGMIRALYKLNKHLEENAKRYNQLVSFALKDTDPQGMSRKLRVAEKGLRILNRPVKRIMGAIVGDFILKLEKENVVPSVELVKAQLLYLLGIDCDKVIKESIEYTKEAGQEKKKDNSPKVLDGERI